MQIDHSVVLRASFYAVTSTFASISVHEVGHLAAARLLCIKVLSISIGFGPELFGFTDGEGTRWGVAPWLIGGKCSFPNEITSEKDKSGQVGSLSDASLFARAIVCASGPLFNFIFAGLCSLLIIYHRRLHISDLDAELGLPPLLVLTSVVLGLFNCLPLPPLDGGRLLLLALEACRGTALTKATEGWIVTIGSWSLASASVLTFIVFVLKM